MVSAFLKELIPFTQIPTLIEDTINQHDWINDPNLDDISKLRDWASQFIKEQITTYA